MFVETKDRIDGSRHADAAAELIESHQHTVSTGAQAVEFEPSSLVGANRALVAEPDGDAGYSRFPLIVGAIQIQIAKDSACDAIPGRRRNPPRLAVERLAQAQRKDRG